MNLYDRELMAKFTFLAEPSL